MVIEMSAETYDWGRAEHQARGMIHAAQEIADACSNAPAIDLDESPDPETALDPDASGGWSDWQENWRLIVESHKTHLGGLPMELSADYWSAEHNSDPGVHLTVKSGSSSHHFKFVTRYQPSGTVWVTAMRMDVWGSGGMHYVFKKSEVDGMQNTRWETYLDEMSYWYKFKREAELLARETFFSDREAEVLILQREGWSNKHISRVADISESTISTYRSRRSDKEQKAHEEMAKARRTLEVLTEAENLPTARCTELPASIGRVLREECVPEDEEDDRHVAQFAWLPEEFEATNLVRGVPIATFARVRDSDGVEDGAVLVIDRPETTEYYMLDADDLDDEVERFRTASSPDGKWVGAGELTPQLRS